MIIIYRVFIIFIYKKERSTEAVPTGMVRHTIARVLKPGHITSSSELTDNSFKYLPLVDLQKVFHSVGRSEETKAGLTNVSPMIDSAGSVEQVF